MSAVFQASYIATDYLKQGTPWICLVGAPDFPDNVLFQPSATFGQSEKVEKEYDTNGRLIKITGTNSLSQISHIDISYDISNQKITVECYNGTTKELTIIEQFSATGLNISTTCHANTSKNLTVNVARNSSYEATFDVTININSSQLTGQINWGANQIPQIFQDLIDEVSNMGTPQSISAFEKRIQFTLLEDAGSGDGPHTCLNENDMCAIGSAFFWALSFVDPPIGAIGGAVWLGANWLICDQLQDSREI